MRRILTAAIVLGLAACAPVNTSNDYSSPDCVFLANGETICDLGISSTPYYLRDDYCPDGEYPVQAGGRPPGTLYSVGHYCSGDVPEGFEILQTFE